MTPKELEQSIRALMQRQMADAELPKELEKLAAAEISFSGFTWLFGLRLYRRMKGFLVNATKTRLTGQGGCQRVTGVVVNKTLGLSRKERRHLRAVAHRLVVKGGEAMNGQDHAWLRGKMAYLAMLNPAQAERLQGKMRS